MQITNALGQTLNLYPNTALNVERHNPLFNDADKFFADITYPFKAPPTPNNKLFFKGGHRVEALNELYEFDVQVHINGTHFFTGVCTYKMSGIDFDCNLKVNFGAIVDKVKNTRLPEIKSNDANYTFENSTPTLFEAHMKNVTQFHNTYEYNFLPVLNKENTVTLTQDAGLYNINHYNFTLNKFLTFLYPNNSITPTVEIVTSPFFKITYILKNILKYLGYNFAGSFFSSNYIKNIYIYTRRSTGTNVTAILNINGQITGYRYDFVILESMAYMPNMSISEFLKQIKERLHLSFDFNATTKTCTVESFDSIVTGQSKDISQFLNSIEEITTVENGGFSVTLKPDEQDALNAKIVRDETLYIPDYKLDVGKATNPIELDCSTLKSKTENLPIVTTTQPIITRHSTDDDFPYTDEQNPNTRNNWPLRLIKYNGWVTQTVSGVTYTGPSSQGLELDDTDAVYYQFLTSAKSIILNITIDSSQLSQLNVSQLIHFKTPQGAYISAIIKKISFTLGQKNGKVKTKIEALTVSSSPNVAIKFINNIPPAVNLGLLFSAYFDAKIHNITSLNIQVFVGIENLTATIVNPTDSSGAGGKAVGINLATVPGSYIYLKITQGKPKYVAFMGKQYPFVLDSGFYGVYLPYNSPLGKDTYWIVF